MGRYWIWRQVPVVAAVLAVAGVSTFSFSQTRVLLSSATPGPTVLILNQAAGTEITGETAIEQVSSWELTCGNVLAASVEDKDAAGVKADVVIRLAVTRDIKQTASVEGRGIEVKALAATLNGLRDEKGEELKVVEPKERSSEVSGKTVTVTLVIKEGGTVPAARTRLFRHAVYQVLADLKMTTSNPWTLVRKQEGKIAVAVYAGIGSNATPGVTAYPRALGTDKINHFTYVGPAELKQKDLLKQFDVIVFCGGMSRSQSSAIGAEGAAAVQEFVRGGGGYVSSCAGSYLATSGFSWSLKMIDADVVDYAHWLRGTGPVDIEVTEEGKKLFGDFKGLVSVKYANGPLLGPAKDSSGLKPYTTLATFKSDMAKGVPGGVMPGTPAIISGEYGEGRVICFSPHPEYVEGLEAFITQAVRWAAKKPIVTKKTLE